MTIHVPDSAKALIDDQATKAGYANAGEYVLSLVERDRSRVLRQEIETQLAEAIASPSSPMTEDDWSDIRQLGRKIIEQENGR
ncbi:MAG TPA: hypothetical protein VGG19_07570 [Tepidisphaeraceae bacterium]|jgi:Arc/MetJ-type ribon-helix-helix transcriptional regulator